MGFSLMLALNVGSIPAGNVLLRFACLRLFSNVRELGLRLIRSLPLAHPYGLRLCRSTPVGSIPAGDILEIGKRIAETGKIVAGFIYLGTAHETAMERFSTALGPELADDGIAVNALRPGAVKTELATLELVTGPPMIKNEEGFLGLTFSCARCPDHKFAPIPQADYYSLHAIFASCNEPLPRPEISNPQDNPNYISYLGKRADILNSPANLIEIDLLRSGPPMPAEDRPE
jgi:NAD(P)-dependent dehydrogenase (short-subunit alcohol dehydrogenase family)